MKEKYDNLTDFLNDILEAAEIASKDIINDIKNDNKCEDKCEEKPKLKVKSNVDNENKKEQGCIMDPHGNTIDNRCLKPLPGNIVIDNDNHYILNEMCNGWPTIGEYHLIFEHFTEDGYKVPGVTDSQILAVLYNRYKNNPKKLDLVRQLMN